MSDVTYDEIKAIIQRRTFETLIEREEGQYLEVKGAAGYDLGQPNGKYELVKDITAFANSNGGFILIGMTHKRLENKKRDVIAGFDYVTENQIDAASVREVFNKHIYPKIKGFEIGWQQHGAEINKGIVVVHVPPQDSSQKPYLITRIIEEGEQVQGYVLGVVERDGDSNVPWNVVQVHKILRRGKSEEIDRLIAIEGKIDRMVEHAVDAAVPRAIDLMEERMEQGEVGE